MLLLMVLDTVESFSTINYKGHNFHDLFDFLHTKTYLEIDLLKRERQISKWSKIFSF